jgi:hypothetical protein
MAKKPFPFKVCEQCCEGGDTGGGSGESEQFFVNITKQTTGNSADGITTTYTADKTYDEIYAAYQANKHIIAKVTVPNTNGSTGIYHLTAEGFGELYFTVIQWATIPAAAELVCYPDNTWVGRSNSLEVKENKVSKISSENPANYNYPSEKAVADYVASAIGEALEGDY